MTKRARTLALSLTVAAGALAGCRAEIPVGRFACALDLDCPPGQRCVAGLCETGTGSDAGPLDAPGLDAPGADAPIDAPGPLPDAGGHRVRILNAIGDDGGFALPDVLVSVEAETRTIPFGCTETYLAVERGTLNLEVAFGTTIAPLSALVSADTLVVIGRSAGGSVSLYVTPDVPPTPTTAGATAVRYLDLVQETMADEIYITLDIADLTGSTAPIAFGSWSAPSTHTAGYPIAVGLSYLEVFVLPRILTTFTTMPTQSALVVLTGDADRHPGAPGGPRAIVVPPVATTCSTPVLPDAQIALANLARDRLRLGSSVNVCQIDSGFAAIPVGSGAVSVTTSTYGGLTTFGLSDTEMGACLPTSRIMDLSAVAGLRGGGVQPGGRYIVAVTGLVRMRMPMDWEVTVIEEPVADAPSAAGGATRTGVTFTHVARATANFPLEVSVEGAALVVIDTVAVGATDGDYSAMSLVGTFPYRVTRDLMPGVLVGVFDPTGTPTRPTSVFAILTDVDNALGTVTTPRIDAIDMPYGRTATVTSIMPR